MLVALVLSGIELTDLVLAALLVVPILVIADLLYRIASEPDEE